jgi:hypothetical protein
MRNRHLSPNAFLVGVDAEAEFADELVGEQRAAGVDASEPGVAEELLEAAALADQTPIVSHAPSRRTRPGSAG